MNAQRESDLDAKWGWVVNATPRSLYPPAKRPGTRSTGGWAGPRSGVESLVSTGI